MEKLEYSNYVDRAEKVIESIKVFDKKSGEKRIKLSTSQIRNLLSLISEIYNDVVHSQGEKLTQKQMERIQYLKVKVIYTAGRDQNGEVKKFVKNAGILECIDNIKNSKEQFVLFSRYMEALVAFHKFQGGND